MKAETLSDLAIEFNQYGMLPAALQNDHNRATRVLWELNTNLRSSSYLPGADHDYTYLATDDFAHITALKGPEKNTAHAHVFLMEDEKDPEKGTAHHEVVYEYASHYAHAINPAVNLGTINALRHFPAELDTIPTNSAADRGHHMIFSVSMENPLSKIENLSNTAIQDFQSYNQGAFTRLTTNHIYFLAAGNYGNDQDRNRIISVLNMRLTGRAYVVGATDTFVAGQSAMLADYSSTAPDFLMPPLPTKDGYIERGTSFATPMAAVLDAQLMRWYGGVLSQEEIMAAGLMTTDMNVRHSGSDGLILFNTNSGGLPYSPYAGAGMIDPQKWVDTLDIMASLKQNMQHEPQFIESVDMLSGNPPTVENLDGTTFYTYRVKIEQDMTLDRLTFVLPQEAGKRAATHIISPSGFMHEVPTSPEESHATMAFATEDVKAGDEILISSPQPYGDQALVMIRGYTDGNVIQMTRDLLHARGQLPEPLTTYYGGNTVDSLIAKQSKSPAPQTSGLKL